MITSPRRITFLKDCLWSVTVLVILVKYGVAARPYIEDPTCPRKPELAVNRKCLKKCRGDFDCRGLNKQCLCDDVCGKSCVKKTLRCEPLKAIFNGKYEITPFNAFGNRVRYTCIEGYILSGQPERICQGDGYWSGEPPTCETEDTMQNATTNAWKEHGKCRNPPIVPHAGHDGPVGQRIFPLGTQLTYTCDTGHTIDGFFRAMCVGEGRWVGPRMTCSPRRCGHPGDIPNGRREGNVFVFPSRIIYTCMDGYELVGRNYRLCQQDGKWSGSLPTCRPVKCPRLGAPANGHIQGTDTTYGAIVRFTCLRGFTLVGSGARRCQNDGIWSGKEATCAMVDCGLPGPFYNGYLGGQQTTFGAVLFFQCFGRTTFSGESNSSTCQENGKWSHPIPNCWKKCTVPSVENGTLLAYKAGNEADHETKLRYRCNHGHKDYHDVGPECYNGTWSFMPECVAAPCEVRPEEVRDGMVRFYTMKHNDRAKYKCNPGFELIGDKYMMCRYGEWVGKKPYCRPVYCPFPGTIEHGQILLVGFMGKYEYRPYVRRIGHNEQIEYVCSKEFKRIGPQAATCVDGNWSPSEKPKCVPKQHPKLLYMFRGKRSVTDDNPDHNSMWDFGQDKGFCEVPKLPFGTITNYAVGDFVPHDSELKVSCEVGFVQATPATVIRCDDGTWTDKPTCWPDAWSIGT